MSTLKPQLVRADTLDLQDHDAPSAQDHTRQPTHPAPYGFGPAAPHQTQALRNAEREVYQQQKHSPRVSEDRLSAPFPEEPNFYDEPDDDYGSEQADDHIGQNGVHREDHDMEDGDPGDDDMDDDMLDKISSSPSIDDGKYVPTLWPPRADSVDSGNARSPFSTPTRGNSPYHSSPFTSPPDFHPLSISKEVDCAPASHQNGEYGGASRGRKTTESINSHNIESPLSSNAQQKLDKQFSADSEISRGDHDLEDITMYLLPTDDPLLANSFDDAKYEGYDQDDDWEDEDEDGFVLSDISSDDDTGHFIFTDDTRFIDSGWGGECLREIEDIDFEFVYALHTFVATVEGQANATKGNTMVLLDDSNSYWWLVRVVKDGSIGYLPAEHIETPTERLARLNKHRNIDLSATMLGDNPEKSKNPLKKAMKRRNQKTVQFTAPTYYEPSEYDGSDDDEDDENQSDRVENGNAVQSQEFQKEEDVAEVAAVVAPLAVKPETEESRPVVNGIKRITSDESINSEKQSSPEKMMSPEAAFSNGDVEGPVSVSRRGVVRNTDSFFKDDSVETKKISLTPRLLRGDSEMSANQEHQDLRQRPSLETFDKTFDKILASDERPKDDKRKKEKKGMLRGLFGRKEKPAKGVRSDADDFEKISEESVRFSPQSKDSLDSTSSRIENGPERKPSKLQKPPPPIMSPKISPIESKPAYQISDPTLSTTPLVPSGPAPLPPISRPVDTEPRTAGLTLNTAPSHHPENLPRTISPISPAEKKSMFSPLTNALRTGPSTSNIEDASVTKPVYSKIAKSRFVLDEGDSDDDETPTAEFQNHRSISPLKDPQQMESGRRNSPVLISPIEATEKDKNLPPQRPPALVLNTTSEAPTPIVEVPGAFPETAMEEHDGLVPDSDQATSSIKDSPATDVPTPSTSRSTPTWSDASLRSYMDNDQDIRDLLIIVHDKSNVMPAGPDHPFVSNLFVNERSRLAEMQGQLDSLLTGWITRKNTGLLAR